MLKRIIFDIDGTLIANVNPLPYIAAILQQYNVKDLHYAKAKQLLSIQDKYEEPHDCYDKDQYLSFFSKELNTKLDHNFLQAVFDGIKKAVPSDNRQIKAVLDELTDYELVLLSNFFEEIQRGRLAAMGINDYFSEYYGEDIIKPHKQAYMQAKGPHRPEECLIIGDNKRLDVDIPKTYGFKAIHVGDGGDIATINELSLPLIQSYFA